MVWLAACRQSYDDRQREQLKPRWRVLGMDFVAPHLERIHAFARSFGVGDRVRTTRAKILDSGAVRVCDSAAQAEATALDFSQRAYDLVMCVRFLHRSFFPALRRMVAVGGFLLYQTWVAGQPGLTHPTDERCVLRAGELAREFGPHATERGSADAADAATPRFSIVVDRVEWLPDGRPVNCFVAQRIA
jgi:hypothetical protein